LKANRGVIKVSALVANKQSDRRHGSPWDVFSFGGFDVNGKRLISALVTGAFSGLFCGNAMAQAVSINVDQTQPLRFNMPVTGVVVGNAGIADVIVHDSTTLFVIGKSIGTTHVLAVDQRGRTVYSGQVQVRAATPEGLLTIQRGKELSTSICDERCIAYAHSESSAQGLSEAISRATARTGFASGGGRN
jgi:Pilus formation protein N terminal region